MSFRTYHDVAGEDRSRLAEQVAAQRQRVRDRMRSIGRVVAVMSGKGGVGKSHVAAALAVALAPRSPGGVGVLDADLASPTVARLLDARGPVRAGPAGVQPAIGRFGVKLFSTDLLLGEGQPLRWRAEGEAGEHSAVWRGALEAGALRELLADVEWGALELLLVDLPPGTDRLADVAALLPELAGAVAVTIPTEESRRSVARAIRSAEAAGVRVLGVIENMSGYDCASCGALGPLFEGNAGDALAAEFGLPLLARLPFAPPARRRAPTYAASCDALVSRLREVLA